MVVSRLLLIRSNSSSMCGLMYNKCYSSVILLSHAVCHKTDQYNAISSEKKFTEPTCSSFNFVETECHIAETTDPSDYKCYVDYVKNLLYPVSTDRIIIRLKDCITARDVLNIVSEYNREMDVPQICQSVLMLQQIRLFSPTLSSCNSSSLTDFNLISDNSFQKLLNLIDTSCSLMNFTELSCCLLYLNKLGVPFTDDLMIKVVTLCEKQIKEIPFHEIPLNAILKFCAAIQSYPKLWSLYTLKNVLPLLIDRLRNCDTCNELYLITLCLKKMALLMNDSLLDTYNEKCDYILRNIEDNKEAQLYKMMAIEKAISFLNHNVFYEKNINAIRKLSGYMQGNVHLLSLHDLYTLYKKTSSLQEPALLLKEINDVCYDRISRKENTGSILSNLWLSIIISHRGFQYNNGIKQYLNQSHFFQPVLNFSLIYRLLQSNVIIPNDLVVLYWLKIVELMNAYPDNRSFESLVSICIRYLNVKHSLLRSFEYEPFEKAVTVWLLNCLSDEDIHLCPYTHARILTLLMAFSNNSILNSSRMREAVRKMEANISRFTISDNTFISYIISCALDLKRFKKISKPAFLQHYVKLTAALHENSKETLQKQHHLSASYLHDVLYSYLYRKGSLNSDIFKDITNRLEGVSTDELNSKLIKKILGLLSESKHIIPAFVDKCAVYCIDNKDIIHANIAGIVLTYSFNFGYWPNNIQELLEVTNHLIERDYDSIGYYAMLKCVLCFAYFNYLSSGMINRIFNVDYIKKLENHMSSPNGSRTFDRIKLTLMELNRSACLDYPEYNVPWFHEDYRPVTRGLKGVRKGDAFYEEVLDVLVKIVMNENFVDTNHYSPYNHPIDFFICFGKDGLSVNPLTCSNDSNVKKIAVLLETSTSETYYFHKGKEEICHRHLEILNYKVIWIKMKYWNSMFMSEPMAKLSYVRDRLYSV